MSINLKPLSTKQDNSNSDIKDIQGLRNAALNLLNKIMKGNADFDELKAFCLVSNTVLSTLKVEIDYIRILKREQGIPFIPDVKKLDFK